MFKIISVLACGALPVLVLAESGILGNSTGTKNVRYVQSTPVSTVNTLWMEPTDIRTRDLYYGPGGKEHAPGQHFVFLEEDMNGTNPKFDVQDENGEKWKVKLGNEAQPEVVSTRLVWSVGYNTDEDYLVPVLRVEGLAGRLKRGANLIQPDGTVLNARLKRREGKKIGEWKWRAVPFEHTTQFNGLRVMMALIDNWDLKDVNNAIVERNGLWRFEVSDLGASFGSAGDKLDKSVAKNNLDSYSSAAFITHVGKEHVDFGTPALPPPIFIFDPMDYERRAHLRWIGKHIPITDAKWTGQWLTQLSDEQIRSAFRAANYPADLIDAFTRVLEGRIQQLKFEQ